QAVGVPRRPVQLVRAPLTPPVLAGVAGGVRHPVRVPGDGDPAAGAAHAVRHRLPVGRAARRRPAVLGPPDRLAGGPPGPAEPGAVGADGAGAAAGGAGPLGPRLLRREDPPAAPPRPGGGARLAGAAGRAA